MMPSFTAALAPAHWRAKPDGLSLEETMERVVGALAAGGPMRLSELCKALIPSSSFALQKRLKSIVAKYPDRIRAVLVKDDYCRAGAWVYSLPEVTNVGI